MKYEALLATVLSKNETLISADNSIESKLIGVSGFNIAVLFGYIGLITDGQFNVNILSTLGIIILFISLGVSFSMLFPTYYHSSAVNLLEHPEYFDKSEEELYLQVISNAEEAFRLNNDSLKIKSTRLKNALLLSSGGGILLVISLLFNFC